MSGGSDDQILTMRTADQEDSSALVMMCRACFRRSPEWYAPGWVVRRWWRGLIRDSACHVEVIEHDRSTVGYLVTTSSYSVWRHWLAVGPNRKWLKLMVMLTRPAMFKSLLKKKLRARAASGADKPCGEGSTKLARVTSDSVIAGRSGLYLANMAMIPETRGLGGGKRIVERFIELGISEGVEVLWLHVDPRNEVAQGLYARYGFVTDGVEGSSLLMSRAC